MNPPARPCRKGARKDLCRPRDAAATREAILDAARRRFVGLGYEQVGLRAIAADAGVDAALIHRYFGSKEQLFAQVLDCPGHDPMDIIRGQRGGCGQRLAEALLADPGERREGLDIVALIAHSAKTPEAGPLIRAHMEQRFIRPFSEWLGDADAQEKAWMVSSVMMGAALLRDIRPALPGSREALGRTLQGIIDAEPGISATDEQDCSTVD